MFLGNYSLFTLHDAATKLLAKSRGITVWTFQGDMGAGKTTLIKQVCRVLGVTDAVSSPTYALVNEYTGLGAIKVYHFDLYRLKDINEAYDIDISSYFHSGSYCLVEWPQVAQALLPDSYLEVTIQPGQQPDSRDIYVKDIYR